MSSFTTQATERLREHGYRITGPRRRILALLDESAAPIAPAKIHALLARETDAPDLVTFYRVLAVLEQLRIVHQVHSVAGYIACRSLGAASHHPLICSRCGAVRELDLEPLSALIQGIEAAEWQIEGSLVEFTGICPKCRRNGS